MSNQFLKLRRSGVPDKVPTTESIDYGEIALNTYDGKAYMKVSGSEGIKVVQIGATSGSFSGSFLGDFTGTFSGSFSGSGADLSNIPASAIVGLNLSQISSGSYSASISEAGLLVNNTVVAPSFTGSFYGTASWAENAVNALFASDYVFTSSVLEYYVDRRFTGSCQVTIGSNRSITSTNAGYLTQLSESRIGDPNHPWPDPWTAGFVASASIATGQATSTRVIIKTGNEYTYGSSVFAQNGDNTGSLVNTITPDIAVSQSNYNNRAFDLLSPNVEFYFEPETALYNINKTWQQELVRYSSSNWDIAPEFKITGKGKFVLVYGEARGFICRYGSIGAPRAQITIEADHMIQNMWQGWVLHGQKIDIDVDKWWSQSSNTLLLNYGSSDFYTTDNFYNWPSQSLVYPSYSIQMPVVNLNVNEYRWGENLFAGVAPPDNDYWTNIVMGHPYGTTYNINIKNIITRARHTDGFFRFAGGITGSYSNCTANINVNYISASIGTQSNTRVFGGQLSTLYLGAGPGSVASGVSILYNNCNYFLNINKFDSNGIGLGNNVNSVNAINSTTKIHCEDYRNYAAVNTATSRPENPCIIVNFTNWVNILNPITSGSINNNQTIISGNYRNYSTGSLISFSSANSFGNDNTLGNTLILDNFRGYQMNQTRNNLGAINVSNWSSFWSTFVYSTGSLILTKDSMIYATGSTPLFAWNNNGILGRDKVPTIILDNVLANKDISGSFNFEGNIDISSNVGRIIY